MIDPSSFSVLFPFFGRTSWENFEYVAFYLLLDSIERVMLLLFGYLDLSKKMESKNSAEERFLPLKQLEFWE